MKTCKRIVMMLLGLAGSSLLFPTTAAAQSDRPVVKEIAAAVTQGSVALNVQLESLFSRRISGTIRSGLPAVIQLEIELHDARNKKLLTRAYRMEVRYHIWDEYYAVACPDSLERITTFDDVKNRCSNLNGIVIGPLPAGSRGSTYSVRVRAGISPLASAQDSKVGAWLNASSQKEEELLDDERTTGFKLNLSRLISSFFMNDDDGRWRKSEWRTARFAPLTRSR